MIIIKLNNLSDDASYPLQEPFGAANIPCDLGKVILDNFPSALFVFDGQQCLVECSRASLSILNLSNIESLLGRPVRDVFANLNDDCIDQICLHNLQTLEHIRPVNFVVVSTADDDHETHYEVTINPITTGSRGTVLTISDISELAQLRKRVEDVSLTKSSFLSSMSHEIRTPLNAIKGLSELLALTPLNNIQTNYSHNIIASTNALLNIINDVLDFSNIDSEDVEIIVGDYSLAGLISEVSNIIGLRASEKDLAFYLDIDPDLPRLLIGDDVRIKQILTNVLGNAVKYTLSGHIIFTIQKESTDTDGLINLICTVEDTGVGIRESDIDSLFNPFFRADIHSNRNISGTGLGLSITQRLLESMDGSISVESVFGQGSVFTISLPQYVADPAPLAVVEDAAHKNVLVLENEALAPHTIKMLEKLHVPYVDSSIDDLNVYQFTHCIFGSNIDSATIRRMRARMANCVFIVVKDMRYAMDQTEDYDAVLFMPLLLTDLARVLDQKPRPEVSFEEKNIDTFALRDTHILVVDDNEVNLLVSGELLRSYKADVTYAESGMKALDLCENVAFDMIFMDHMMPEMDGIETTIEIRKRYGINRNTPIVALTANVIDDMRSRYIESGMDDFIGKPIEIEEISRVLRKWIPSSKIVTTQDAFNDDSHAGIDANGTEPIRYTMERLIVSLDAFGMYVSDVMREIDNDYALYLERIDRIRTDLSPLVSKLRGEVAAQDWDAFADDIHELATMIHDVGARDCSGRARKLYRAAKEYNADYIRSDFFSLMNNMYMLQKKMEVAVPIARGELDSETPFGDKDYCCGLLVDMKNALTEHDIKTVMALIESLSSFSLDHDLDMILLDIKEKLEHLDFDAACSLHEDALEHCMSS